MKKEKQVEERDAEIEANPDDEVQTSQIKQVKAKLLTEQRKKLTEKNLLS